MSKAVLKEQLYNYGYPKAVLNKLNKKELEFMLLEHDAKGAGFLSNLFDKGYQKVSNSMRKKMMKEEPERGIRELEPGEHHITMYDPVHKRNIATNWSGPGTDLQKHPNAPPTSLTDAVAMKHDYDYLKASKEPNKNKRAEMIRKADNDMKDALRNMPLANHELEKWMSLAGIEAKTKAEDIMPMADKLISDKYFGREAK